MVNNRCRAGFIICPSDKEILKDKLTQKHGAARVAPATLLESIGHLIPLSMLKMGTLNGVMSHLETDCDVLWVDTQFHAVALTPNFMRKHPDRAVTLITEVGHLLTLRGAKIVGLGGHNAIAGRKGKGEDVVALTKERGYKTRWTTGNGLTVWVSVFSLLRTGRELGHDIETSTIGVLGATGSVGRAASIILASENPGKLLLCARNPEKLAALRKEIGEHHCEVVSREELISRSNLIIAVTSETSVLNVDQSLFLPGAVICDAERPRSFAQLITRPDVLVYEGGLLKVPGADPANQTVDLLLSPGIVPACVGETMVLALEGWEGDFSIGELRPNLCMWLGNRAKKHGFEIAGLRNNDREIDPSRLDRIREAVEASRR